MNSDIKAVCEREIAHYKECLKIVKGFVVEEAFYRGCICALKTLLQQLNQ